MTVKELKEFIKDLPDDTEIYVGGSINPDFTNVRYELRKTFDETYAKLIFS